MGTKAHGTHGKMNWSGSLKKSALLKYNSFINTQCTIPQQKQLIYPVATIAW